MTNRPTSSERGAALIVALLVFALAVTLVVAMSSEFTLYLKRTSNSLVGEQAWAYLVGGEELAALALKEDHDLDQEEAEQRDDLTEFWAQSVPPYALDEGGWLVGRLEDLQGRFNINSVEPKPRVDSDRGRRAAACERSRFTAAQQQFARLLQAFEKPPVSEQEAVRITCALMDWLDDDSNPNGLDGAEDNHYYGMTPPYRAANRKLHSVSELRLVAGMTPELFEAVEPYLTALDENTTINIHTAPAPVLRTLNCPNVLAPLEAEDVKRLLALDDQEGADETDPLSQQDVRQFENMDTFLERISGLSGCNMGHLAADDDPVLGETSSWFLYSGEVDVAGRVSRLYSVLRREDRAVSALARSSGDI